VRLGAASTSRALSTRAELHGDLAVLARRAEGNADLMEIQRDYVGLRGEICSPLKYRASLRNGVGPKLAGDERYGRENVASLPGFFLLWFERL
jgi:hypothetical protein